MSQTKAQLIQPIGVVTASTIQVSGVVTATTFVGDVTGTVTGLSTTTANLDVGIVTTSGMVGDVTGSASSVYSGNNIVVGVVTATKFTGNTSGRSSGLADGTNANVGIVTATSFIGNLTGNAASLSNTDSQLNLGIVTATSFAGNFTGIGSGLTGTPNVVAGVVTSTFVGNFTGIGSGLSGTPNVRAGVVTASSFIGDFTGIGSGLTGTPNVTAGVVTASSFIGNFTGHASGLTGTPDVTAGLVTASSLLGNFTGFASGITGTPNITAGVITATAFAGNFTGIGSGLTGTPNYTAGIVTASSFIGNFTGIGSGLTGTPSFTAGIVTASSFLGNFTGVASGITGTPNITVAIMTATSFNGDGSSLTGIAATNWITNNVTANSSSTAIDLSLGNVIKFTQTANTTVSFANTGTSNIVTFIRPGADYTITWPSSIKWNDGSAPPLASKSADDDVFALLTRDEGVTWYGWETVTINKEANKLLLWGKDDDGFGGLGQNGPSGSTLTVRDPTEIFGGGNTWSQLKNRGGAEEYISGAIKTDGTLWVWGRGSYGQLGQGNNNSRSSPVQIPGTTWGRLHFARYHAGATKTDGTLWTWGSQYGGRLGYAPSANAASNSPKQIPGTSWANGDDKFSLLDGGGGCIRTDGTLYMWGTNESGSLGQNNETSYSSPRQIPGTTWDTLSCSYSHAAAIKTDGTLWTWGRNHFGNLGHNQGYTSPYEDGRAGRSSPTQVGSDTNWKTVCQGRLWMAATKTDGTMWAWGRNNWGNLGQNSTSPGGFSSPVQIPGTDWTGDLSAGSNFMLASKTDGTLWGWGVGSQLAQGEGNNTNRSSPIQISGYYGSMANFSTGGSISAAIGG